jgi:hypothetical protein
VEPHPRRAQSHGNPQFHERRVRSDSDKVMVRPLRIAAAIPGSASRERKFRERLAKIRETQHRVKHDQQADQAERDDGLQFGIEQNRGQPRPRRLELRSARVSSRRNRRKFASHRHFNSPLRCSQPDNVPCTMRAKLLRRKSVASMKLGATEPFRSVRSTTCFTVPVEVKRIQAFGSASF